MFRRFLRSLGGQDADAVPPSSYVDDVLATSATHIAASAEGTIEGDALHFIGDLFTRSEATRGWDEITLEGSAREQFLRTYAGMLLENDRLPPTLQLTPDEFRMPRRLLHAFFGGSSAVQREAQAVLHFVEERFSAGRHGQARLLLQLFDTDAATRRNNERNLFWEEMLLRFTSTRTASVPDDVWADYQRAAAETLTAQEEGIRDVAAWLRHNAGIRLHLFGRDWIDQDAWAAAMEPAPEATRHAMSEVIPAWRWRPVDSTIGPIGDALDAHVGERGFQPFVRTLTQSAYFVTLAPGATGLEEFLFRYITWLDEHFDCSAIRVLPDLHRQTTIEEVGLPDALDAIHASYLRTSNFGSGVFSEEAIRDALAEVQRSLQSAAVRAVPEGDYNLGGLVMGVLVGFPYEDIAQALRVHRLT